jgi:hypothetical protein
MRRRRGCGCRRFRWGRRGCRCRIARSWGRRRSWSLRWGRSRPRTLASWSRGRCGILRSCLGRHRGESDRHGHGADGKCEYLVHGCFLRVCVRGSRGSGALLKSGTGRKRCGGPDGLSWFGVRVFQILATPRTLLCSGRLFVRCASTDSLDGLPTRLSWSKTSANALSVPLILFVGVHGQANRLTRVVLDLDDLGFLVEGDLGRGHKLPFALAVASDPDLPERELVIR